MSGISYQGRGKKLFLDGFQDTSLSLRLRAPSGELRHNEERKNLMNLEKCRRFDQTYQENFQIRLK